MVWAIIGVIVVVLLIFGGIIVGSYNGLVKLRNLVQESWRQIDVELNRRYELIPNLVETVRGYAAHERNTLEDVVRLRNQAASMAHSGANQAQRSEVEQQLSGAVKSLMVSVEAYPELKSNVNFLELQRELTETEDRIAAGRRFYNANVRAYNTKIQSFPTNIIANQANFEEATYFEVRDQVVRQAPSVNFGEISYRDRQNGPGQIGSQPSNPTAMPNPNEYNNPPQQYQNPGEFR